MTTVPLKLPRPSRRLLLAASAASVLTPAWAVPGDDEPPLPQAPRPLLLPDVQSASLANGLQVVVAPRPNLPLVTATLLVRAGPETDLPGRAGASAMATALWPKGALRQGKPVGAAEIARQAEVLGSALDTRSSWGASTLTMTVSTPRLNEALALMTDVLRFAQLAPDELERARAQAMDSLRITYSNPGQVAQLALRRAWWGDGTYGAVAPAAAIKRLTRADVQAFQAQWVRPDRVSLVLAGDITLEQAQALAQRLLGDWKTPAAAAPSLAMRAPSPIKAPVVLIDMPGSGQSGVSVAAPFVTSGLDDRAARIVGQVANAVLGGGYSARLNQEIRIRRGLSYGATSLAESQPSGGMFEADTQTQHASAAQVLRLMRELVSQLASQPPSAAELAARQATLVGSFVRRLETTSGVAALLTGQLAQGRPLADLAGYADSVLAVTPAQVQAFAQRHWGEAQLRAVVVGDLSAAGAGLLEAAGPDALRLTMAQLDLEQAGLARK